MLGAALQASDNSLSVSSARSEMSKVYITQESERTDSRHLEGKTPELALTTPWLSLKDESYDTLYFDFQQTQMNYYSVFILLIYTTVVVYRAARIVEDFPNALGYFNLFVSSIVMIAATLCCALRLLYRPAGLSKKITMPLICFLETIWLLGWNVFCADTVLLSIVNGHCKADDFTFGCSQSNGKLDNDKMLTSMMVAVFIYLILRTAKWEVVIFSYVLNIAVIIYCIFHYNLGGSTATFFSFLPFSTLALYEYRRQIMRLFELNVEHTRTMEEEQATELRHMIGNVAHDLKTVSFPYLFLQL